VHLSSTPQRAEVPLTFHSRDYAVRPAPRIAHLGCAL
jgi:hypothetical protein